MRCATLPFALLAWLMPHQGLAEPSADSTTPLPPPLASQVLNSLLAELVALRGEIREVRIRMIEMETDILLLLDLEGMPTTPNCCGSSTNGPAGQKGNQP